MSTHLCILGLVLFVGYGGINGEIRLVCPTPQSDAANNTNGRCDEGDEYTPIVHGLLTIHFEEPIVRQGTPLRIRLFDKDDPDTVCVLLDFIPHNDRLLHRSIPPECKVESGPPGNCNTSSYITVLIPDIKCERCVIKLTQIVTNGSSCSRWSEVNNDCTEFHSCANVKIIPTYPGYATTTKYCISLYNSRVYPRWKKTSRISAYEPLPRTSFRFHHVPMKFIDNKTHIAFDIQFPRNREFILNIQIFRRPKARRSMAVYGSVSLNRFMGVIPNDKLSNFRNAFSIGGPVVKVQYDGVELSTSPQMFKGTLFAPTSLSYTDDGWLSGSTFEGVSATFPEAVTPYGNCAAPKNKFVCGLRNALDDLSGMIMYKTTAGRSHITAILPHVKQLQWNVKYSSISDLTDFPYSLYDENVLKATLNIHAKDMTSFRVTESTASKNMTCDVIRAVQVHLWKKFALQAIGSIRLGSTNKAMLQFLINDMNNVKLPPTGMKLVGPSDESLLVEFNDLDSQDDSFGGWPVERVFTVTEAALVVAYWSGHLGFRSKTRLERDSEFYYRGKFCTPLTEWCIGIDHVLCDVIRLEYMLISLSASENMRGESLASLIAISNPPSVSVSALLRDLPVNVTVANVYLTSRERFKVPLRHDFTTFSEEPNALFLKNGTAGLSNTQVHALTSGNLLLIVVLSDGSRFHGVVPSPKHVIGGPFPKPATTTTTARPETTIFNTTISINSTLDTTTVNATSSVVAAKLPFVVGFAVLTRLV